MSDNTGMSAAAGSAPAPEHTTTVGGRDGGEWDALDTPSFMHTQQFANMPTPRTMTTHKTNLSNLLDSEKKLILNQANSEMERKDEELKQLRRAKDEELKQLRRALLYLSEESACHVQSAGENERLKDQLAVMREELIRERHSRQQAEREAERAVGLLKESMVQRLTEREAGKHTHEWKSSFLDASRQNKLLLEDFQQRETGLREEMRSQQEQAHKKYASAIDQLRVFEEEVKKVGTHKAALEQQLKTYKEQHAAQKEKEQKQMLQHRAELARVQETCNEHQRASNIHHQELIDCRAKLEDSQQAHHTLRTQMEDISGKLQDAVLAYEERRTKIQTQKSTIKDLTARVEEEMESRQVLSHELDTASAEIVELRMLVDELNLKEQSRQKTHEDQMAQMCASVEADRAQFNRLREMVEERYDDERAQRAAAETALHEKITQLNTQIQDLEQSRVDLRAEIAASKEAHRKATSQLLAQSQRRDQEMHHAQEVERTLREEVAKLREAGFNSRNPAI